MNILTESRSNDLLSFLIKSKPQHPEIVLHCLRRNLCTQQIVDFLRAESHSGFFPLLRININQASYYLTGAQFLYQLTCTVYCLIGSIGIQPFFVFSRSIGPQSQTLCRQTDIRSVKAGALKYHGLYIVCNFGVFTTHNTCNAHFFFAVINH